VVRRENATLTHEARLLYNRRSHPLMFRRENAALTHEARLLYNRRSRLFLPHFALSQSPLPPLSPHLLLVSFLLHSTSDHVLRSSCLHPISSSSSSSSFSSSRPFSSAHFHIIFFLSGSPWPHLLIFISFPRRHIATYPFFLRSARWSSEESGGGWRCFCGARRTPRRSREGLPPPVIALLCLRDLTRRNLNK